MDYTLLLPNDFQDYEWEIEMKGWLVLDIEINRTLYTFNFYDTTRLNQTVIDDVERSGYFLDENVVVLKTVNVANIKKFIEDIIDTQYLLCLVRKNTQ